MTIQIFAPYERLVPPLSTSEYANLKNSIGKNGLWMPIIVNDKGMIIDGHHRYKICQELNIEAKYVTKSFENELLEKKFVIECNLHRRHLNNFQKTELGLPLLEIEKELAKQRQEKGETLSSNDLKGQSRDIVAKHIGISGTTFERAKKIIELGSEDVKQKLRSGDPNTSINKEYRNLQKLIKKEHIQAQIRETQVNLPETITLYNQDFKTAPIKPESVSLIITDPPYHEKYLSLFKELSEHAFRVLRPGGSVITYCGHFNIGKVITMMESAGLKFHWIISVTHSGPSASVFGRKILVGWKPMLWFTKGDYQGEFVKDCIKSTFQGKEVHEWAQSTVESDYYIKYLTIDNEIVYDPFLGGGTFGVSAKKLGRQFIGCEIDSDYFDIAQRVISAAGVK